MRVLVVDPRDPVRSALEQTLRHVSMPGELEILTAVNADQVCQIFQELHPDLLIVGTSDVESTGQEIARRVRESEGDRHTGIIFIEEKDMDDSALSVRCLEMGADDFVRQGCSAGELIARVRAVLRLKLMTDELRSANHRLRVMSLTDELTGLANMRAFNMKFSEAMRRCRRGETGLGVLMIDLDHFKEVNDTTNHLVGSHVIGETGRLLRQIPVAAGSRDCAARYGGDEFVIVIETPASADLFSRGENIRQVIGSHRFEKDDIVIAITASIGAAYAPAGYEGSAEDLIKAADLMLYQSKKLGRNRISMTTMGNGSGLSRDGESGSGRRDVSLLDEYFSFIRPAR